MAKKLLLINPSKPPAKRRSTKRKKGMATRRKTRRTAAQRAATRKLVAFNRRRRRTTKARPTRRRRRNPSAITPKRRTAYRRAVAAYAPNPRRRRRRSSTMKRRRRTYTRRRRNPMGGGIINKMVMPAVTAAAGAVALDVIWGYLPANFKTQTGAMEYVAKGAGAIGMGWLASQVPGVRKSTADALAVGALTVTFYNAARAFIAQSMPTLKMDGMGYYNPALPARMDMPAPKSNMGLYVPGGSTVPSGVNTGQVSPEMGYYANGTY